MSISVQTTSINIPLNVYSCYFGIFYANSENCFHNSVSSPHWETSNVMHQFPSFPPVPYYADYTQVANVNKCTGSDWLEEVSHESDKIFEYEKVNFNAHENVPKTKKTYDQDSREKQISTDNGNANKIWRPFSPSPSLEVDNTMENCVQKRNSRTTNRHVFHSIKPSNVKIGHSKTSVFKAVKKNSFACTQCSSRYLSSKQLNTHMRVHTGSKPFRCEYPNCFKSFARNEELTRHKRIHSGFKPHLCTVCKKRFGRKDHLSKHLKTHLQTSEKKIYQCSFPGCGHRYTRSDALTRHRSSVHAVKGQK